MSLLFKRRQQESQRMNGLNDYPAKSELKQTQQYHGWASYNGDQQIVQQGQLSHPEPMEITNPRSMPSCPMPAEKDVTMQKILQHSYLQPRVAVQKHDVMNNAPSWQMPSNMNFDAQVSIEGELPPGAYYENPMCIDSIPEDPMTYQSQQPTTEQPINVSNVEQQGRCINSNCIRCKSSVPTK